MATTDTAGLSFTAVNDYRQFKATLVTDPNGNRTAVGFTPPGLPAWIAELGWEERSEGDTAEQPGQVFRYDLDAYDRSVTAGGGPQAMSVSGVRRVEHRWSLMHQENARRAAAEQPPLTPGRGHDDIRHDGGGGPQLLTTITSVTFVVINAAHQLFDLRRQPPC